MGLLERQRLCAEPGCKRAPAYPDQRFCEAHRLPWRPEWRRRAEKLPHGLARPLEPA